ncbi:sigma factor [Methylibium sp.]|uniref:sigma factor n=1 Tax=Methylibium sp. TaxID=2067992 RepID=UPI003D1416C9
MDPSVAAERERVLIEVTPLVRVILMRKSGMSLALDDTRPDNVDAIDLLHDVLARLWARLAEAAAGEIASFRGYAASVAYNAWSDHLRERHPQRASLKNRLRYFLGHQPRYALWQNGEGELLCGLRSMQLAAGVAPAARIAALREGRERLPVLEVPRKPMALFDAEDWDRLLTALYGHLGAALALDDLVAIVARLIDLKEVRTESLDVDDEGAGADELAGEAPGPDELAAIRQQLARLWRAVVALKPDHRCAYLLNLPGPGKSRADIEVFVLHGIASVRQIGAALELSEQQYAIAWSGLELAPGDAADLASHRAVGDGAFGVLWKYLPLMDALIGLMLGLGPQQVINRRLSAVKALARALADTAGAASGGGRNVG